MRLFAEHGYDRTSIDAIAQEAGISRGSIFWHFGTKESLLSAMVTEIYNQWNREIVETVAPRTGLDALSAFLAGKFDRFRREPALVRLGYRLSGEALHRPELAQTMTELRDFYAEVLTMWLTEAREAGELRANVTPEAAADLVLGLLEGAAVDWLLSPVKVDLDELRETLMRLLANSAGAPTR
jgi:TetR/AcrR family acrAB operon transcriptional repressor